MSRFSCLIAAAAATAALLGGTTQAQQPPAKPAPYATTKVEGTDNVYIFRMGNHQAMFIVTTDGVIATDPVAYGKPEGAVVYLEEIRKITKLPVKYVIYSHHHFDHIAGGKPFKDAGARFVAHRRAWERLKDLQDPHTVLPDELVTDRATVRLGNTAVELTYHGLNHSDSTLVMRLPREKLIFLVDTIPVGSVPGRGMIDFYPMETEDFMKKVLAMDWERMIPGHPGAPNGRLGTKKDVQDQLEFLQYASETVKTAAREGKCWDGVEKGVQLPKYESWPGYANNLQFVLRRYCGLWGRGT